MEGVDELGLTAVCDVPEDELEEPVATDTDGLEDGDIVLELEVINVAELVLVEGVTVLVLELALGEELAVLVVPVDVTGVVPELEDIGEIADVVVVVVVVNTVVVGAVRVEEVANTAVDVGVVIIAGVLVPDVTSCEVVGGIGEVVLVEALLVVKDDVVAPDTVLDALAVDEELKDDTNVLGELVELTAEDIPGLDVAVVADVAALLELAEESALED